MLRPIWDAFSRKNMLESILNRPRNSLHHSAVQKPSPWGEGGPAQPGRMRGRFGAQPFLVELEKEAPACRLNGMLLLLRWASRSPPHQSPSVTASPQGEASGSCSPTRKSVPNQGTYMGPVIAPPPGQCATTANTSEWERAGHKPWVQEAQPPALFPPAFSGESRAPARSRAGNHLAGANLRRSKPGPSADPSRGPPAPPEGLMDPSPECP